jgi:hypothetical protein
MSKKEFYEMILEDIADAYWQEYDRGDWMQELESELSMYDLDEYYEEACTTVAERMREIGLDSASNRYEPEQNLYWGEY